MRRTILILLPLLATLGGQSGRADPPPAPPAPTEQPPPVITPPAATDPSVPQIILTDRLGNDPPKTGRIGEIFVLLATKSQNVRQMRFAVSPEVPFDFDPASKKLVFSVATEGTYTLSVVATSPDGGLSTESHVITFGDPSNALPAAMSKPAGPTNYVSFVVQAARQMTHPNRKGDLLAMAGPFSAGYGLIQTGGIRNREELFNFTDKQLESVLGGDIEDCTPFIKALLAKTSTEGGDLGRLGAVWQEISEGCRRASK
jgi:hypothetical protein